MPKKRKLSGANVSFFAFQDIITSVTGILVLIVILLVLKITQPGLLPSAESIPDISLEELEKKIAEGLEKIREVEEIRFKAGGASEEDLVAQIAELKAGLSAEPENAEVNEIKVQIEGLEEEIKKDTEATVDLMVDKSRLQGEAEKIQGLVSAKADDLAESKSSARIWLHKGASNVTPFVVEVNEDKAILRHLDDPTKVEEWPAAEMLSKITTLAGQSNKESSYFVFFVRPNAILQFGTLINAVRTAGFGVGYHPLDETTQLRIAPE